MNGGMAEATIGSATLDDVRAEVFVYFSQFVYTGDYYVPQPHTVDTTSHLKTPKISKTRRQSNVLPSTRVAQVPSVFSAQSSPARVAYSGVRKQIAPVTRRAVQRFDLHSLGSDENLYWPISPIQQRENGAGPPPPRPISVRSTQTLTRTVLTHARTYIFADRYDVTALASLSLKKFEVALLLYKPFFTDIDGLTALVREVYENTPDTAGAPDKLRELVVSYMTKERHMFRGSEQFLTLLKEGGDFVGDFWKIVQHQI